MTKNELVLQISIALADCYHNAYNPFRHCEVTEEEHEDFVAFYENEVELAITFFHDDIVNEVSPHHKRLNKWGYLEIAGRGGATVKMSKWHHGWGRAYRTNADELCENLNFQQCKSLLMAINFLNKYVNDWCNNFPNLWDAYKKGDIK